MLIPPNTPWKGLLPHLEAEHNSADLWCSLMRFTFCVPWRTCKHPARSYQVIDANVAGCRDCGTVHVCVRCNCTCPVCISEEGQEVCTLTGYCLPMVIYSPMEKPDTMFFVEGGQAAQASGSQGRDSEDSRPAVVTPTGKMFRVGADGRKDDVNGTVRFDPSAKKHFSIHRMPGWSSTGAPALIPMPSSYNSTAGCSLLDDSIAPGSGSQLEAPGSGGRKAPHQTAASSSRGGGGGCRVTKSKAKGDVNLNCTVVEDVHHQVLSALNKVLCDRGRLSGSIKWTCVMRDERRKTISKRKVCVAIVLVKGEREREMVGVGIFSKRPACGNTRSFLVYILVTL